MSRRKSLPPRAAWIETPRRPALRSGPSGRCPHGQRGLKHIGSIARGGGGLSLPPRAAWIETGCTLANRRRCTSLPPRAAWIETIALQRRRGRRGSLPPRAAWIETRVATSARRRFVSRCPHGQRGLKRGVADGMAYPLESLPPRAAWIETAGAYRPPAWPASLPPRAAWIETQATAAVMTAKDGRCPHGQRGLKR